MSGISLFDTPGHLMSGGAALWRVRKDVSGYGRAVVDPRGTRAFADMTDDSRRFARERSP